MRKDIPATPAEVVEVPKALQAVIYTISKLADIFRFWQRPAKNAATDFVEMTLLDKIYWAHKSAKPIIKAEHEVDRKGIFQSKRKDICLPEGFVRQESVRFGAVGDLIRTEGLEASRDILYEKVADLIFENDISYANLESLLTTQELKEEVISDKECPTESCSKQQFDALKGHKGKNFTVLHTACNHTLDMGLEGIETTLQQFDQDGIVDVGTNRVETEYGKGKIITKNGIKIGFASATFGLNGREVPEGKEYIVNVAKLLPKQGEADLSLIQDQISHCRAENCDFIIASLHWGYEFEFFPRARQIEIAHKIIESGADAIIAHHTHVTQPVEYYQTQRDPNRIAVIAYSLGSLVWSFSAPFLALSSILNFSIAKGSHGGEDKTYIEAATVTPVFRAFSNRGDSIVMQIERLAGQQGGDSKEQEEYLNEIWKYADLVLAGEKA